MAAIHQTSVGYAYINGLGDGRTRPHERLAQWWWQRAGLELRHMCVNWFEGSYEQKLAAGVQQVTRLLEQHDVVCIIGASAGG